MEQLNSLSAYQALLSDPHSLLIDVRTEVEWEGACIPGIKNLTLASFDGKQDIRQETEFKRILSEVVTDKDQMLIFICRSGKRSELAALYAQAEGYRNCANILDGFLGSSEGVGWRDNQLPIRKYCLERDDKQRR